MKIHPIAVAIALALACAPARAQDSEIAKIREEIRQIRDAYEQRIQALEKRLADTEARASNAEQTATGAQQTASAASRRNTETAFNPAISLILNGTYARTSQDPNAFRITGFLPSGGEVGPPKRSFGLGESELAISANIDPYFRGVTFLSLAPDNTVQVEEAYFQTLALPQALTLKGGRFLSGIGYLNEIHPHAWDFQDAPLPYKAFLGGRLRQDGVQLRWLAPTDMFLELGAELSSGDQFPGNDRNKNGAGGAMLFGHLGGDIGESYAWRAGLSHYRTSARDRTYQDLNAAGATVTNSYTGNARLWAIDGVLKWAPNGNATDTNFKLQGEYFRMQQDGTLAYDVATPGPLGALNATQSGWYVQGVWQFMPQWRIGYRYDELRHGTFNNALASDPGVGVANLPMLASYNPTRNTIMTDWSPTEFSRIRLQLAADRSRVGTTDRQIMLQYIYSLGQHGAHRF
jgi:hypothetical protein